MKLKKLPAHEFDRVAEQTGLNERTREMAKAVLVDGRPQTDVGAEYGMTKQRVGLAVQVIEKKYFESPGAGDSIVNVELDLPLGLAVELAALLRAISECKSATKSARAISQLQEAVTAKLQQLRG